VGLALAPSDLLGKKASQQGTARTHLQVGRRKYYLERDRAKAEFEENAITVPYGASPFFVSQ
jgi:hypothetical protein